MVTGESKQVADRIYDRGVVKFGAFKLKLHEKNPEAPLSPIYINLRKPPDGPLEDDDVQAIGQELYNTTITRKISFDLVAGIPRAGDPIAKVIAELSGKPLLMLNKKTDGEKRRIDSIVGGGYQKGQRVLIVDDLITQADTKKEVICICEQSGLIVSAVVVLLDRGQGGGKDLEKYGHKLLASFSLSDLLDYYVQVGKISQTKYQEVTAYLKK